MHLNSFRLKIALLSGLITGALLIGSGLVLWRISYQLNLDHVDREIRNLGQANLDRVQGGEHWERLEAALKFVAGNRASSGFILWVKNYDQVVYQSFDWPAGLDPESFRGLEKYEGANAPGPGEPPPPPPRRGEPISPANPALPLKTPSFFTRDAGDKTWRIAVMGNPYVTLILAADMGEFNKRMAALRNTYLAALMAALALVAGGAGIVARRALRPVTILTQAAERVTAKGLDQRIPAMPHEPEFNRLITVFNAMLARLEASFQQATRFSADAAHELKTPLARLQMELEAALEKTTVGAESQQIFGSLLDEVSRLKAIVQKLLLLSLADAGQLKLKMEPVDLTRLMENVIEDCQAQAPRLKVVKSLAPTVHLHADPDLLEQVLQNLVSNAIKYNQPDGFIQFELARGPDWIKIRVTNPGRGIPPADQGRIFERFFRVDQARSQRVDGAGLGLSLSREIVRAHGGELALAASNEDATCFEIRFNIEAASHPQTSSTPSPLNEVPG